MQQQLNDIVESLKSAQTRLRALTDKLSDSEWSGKPGPDRWSPAECVEHLNLTSRAYLPLLHDAVAKARKSRANPKTHYRRDAIGWFMSKMIAPRHPRKVPLPRVKTTPDFVPKAKRSRTATLSEFVQLQGALVTLIRSADGLPIDDVKIVSPFGGRMKYNAYSALVILERHEHRHLQQAEEASL
ncbi:MAG: DinB family protein [Gemmatimonadaceae bacterium]